MLMFLSADGVMTAAFYLAFAYLRFNAPQWPEVFHFPSGLMAAAMTMFLLSGSFTMFLAVRATQGTSPDPHAPPRWIGVTIAAWCCFLLVEAVEWVRLHYFVGISLSTNLFGATYFVLTTLHGLHVIGGIIYLTLVAFRKWSVKAAWMYVNFVNLIWLPLFFGLYLAATDLKGL